MPRQSTGISTLWWRAVYHRDNKGSKGLYRAVKHCVILRRDDRLHIWLIVGQLLPRGAQCSRSRPNNRARVRLAMPACVQRIPRHTEKHASAVQQLNPPKKP